MRDWLALRAPLAMATLLGAALLVVWGLVVADRALFLVPPPEQEAEQFMKALHAHNYGAARHALKQGLQAEVTEADLQALARQLEERRPPFEDAQGVSADARRDTASARVELRTADGQRQELDFELEKENGLWKLSSIEPARQVAGGGS